MKPESRAELLRAVEALGARYPHWRLGQLLANVSGWADVDIWDVEDEQLLNAIQRQQEHQRTGASTGPTEQGREIA